MRVFVIAKQRFAVHLRPEEVHAALPAEARTAELDAVEAMSVAASTSRAPNAKSLTSSCRTKAGKMARPTARCAPSSKSPIWKQPTITEAMATE
ncbi:hypothetical protein ABT234_40445 [Streptomyces sp. NPDC001586]|uniref:hypothetical protein n=2 Tax=unclassified Streptomyces TaxID=2593676 RepID=UPI00332B0A27